MAKVDTFPLITSLFTDTRIPIQYLGDGQTNAARQFELSVLLDFVATQLGLTTPAVTYETGDTATVVAGELIQCIAVEAQSGSRTMKIGTSSGADDIMEETTIPTDTDLTFTMNRYTSSTLTLHFTITGGAASVIIFKKTKS